MRNDSSPLHVLASYAIVFVVGAMTPSVVKLYGKYQYRKGQRDGRNGAMQS